MWRDLCEKDVASRHVFELIRDGHRCNLYFDLEVTGGKSSHAGAEKALTTLLAITRDVYWCVQSPR